MWTLFELEEWIKNEPTTQCVGTQFKTELKLKRSSRPLIKQGGCVVPAKDLLEYLENTSWSMLYYKIFSVF